MFKVAIYYGDHIDRVVNMTQSELEATFVQFGRVYEDPTSWTNDGKNYYDFVDHRGERAVRIVVEAIEEDKTSKNIDSRI